MTAAESASLEVVPRRSKGAGAAIHELWAYRELLRHLVGRELKVKYKRSALGWLWSLANPLLVAAVFTLVFSLFLKVPPPIGNPSGLRSYGLFLLAALLSWNFTSNVLTQATESIVTGADLVRKVYFPRAVLVLSHVIAILVSFVLELFVLLALVAALGGRLGPPLFLLPVVVLLQTVFVTGLGLLAASLNVFFRDLRHLLGILLMIWFYGTPVIYPPDRVPSEAAIGSLVVPVRALIRANPMARFVEAYRAVVYDSRLPSGETLAILAVVSGVLLVACFLIFRRLEPRFAEEV